MVLNAGEHPFSMLLRLPRYERGVHVPSVRAVGTGRRDEQFETVEFVLWPGDSFVFFDGAGVLVTHQAVARVGVEACFVVLDFDLQADAATEPLSAHAYMHSHLHMHTYTAVHSIHLSRWASPARACPSRRLSRGPQGSGAWQIAPRCRREPAFRRTAA